nr:HEPN domain-containing protein [Peribacillus sp. TH16]
MIKTDLSSTGNEDFYILNFESIGHETDNTVGITVGNISPNFEDWNYWIIEHNETQVRPNVKLALLLSTCNLFSLFEKISNTGRIKHKYAYHSFITENIGRNNVKEISHADITEIQEIYLLLEKFNKDEDRYTYINKALKDYWQLQSIPSDSPFYILGMFSILEALLVHRSKTVSIGHQITTKLSLLNNRFEHPINFSEIFGATKYKKVIEKLYEYRSDIAHGDFSDFNGDLQVLGDPDNVSKVIHRILKATLKQALKEPQLITDLKNC